MLSDSLPPMIFVEAIKSSCCNSGLGRFFGCLMQAKMDSLSIHHHLSLPFTSRLVEGHANVATGVVFAQNGVTRVNRLTNTPEIFDPIVRRIAVYVIYNLRLDTMHHFPNHPMR